MFCQTGERNTTVERHRWRKARWAIVAAALLVPLLLLAPLKDSSFAIAPDTMSYVRPGAAFWRTGSYLSVPSRFPGPEMDRTPVYPLFVGLFAAGDTLNVWPVVLVQAMLRAMLVILILTLQVPGRLGKVDWRIVAAALIALDLPSALLSLQVLTETFSSFFLVLTLWLYLWWRRSRKLPWLLGAGIIAGVAMLTRPINVFFLPLLLALAASDVRRLPRYERGAALATLLAAAVLFPAAWVLRNYMWSGKMIFSLTGSKNLMYYRAAGIIAEQEGRSLDEVQKRLRARELALAHSEGLTEWESAARLEAEAWEIIRSAPGLNLRLTLAGALRALLGPGREVWADWAAALGGGGRKGRLEKFCIAASLLHLVALYLFAAAGLVRAGWRRFPWLGIWCLAVFLVLIVAAAGPEAYSRFRLPVMPFLAVGVVLLWISPPSPAPTSSYREMHSGGKRLHDNAAGVGCQ
jgi:4-amino-4-deoxy-L-arabinose transferase-like glycosyltransferase